ncbi:hypothetical protein [Streptomyces sp. NPDC047985]|uniref:hypothetical protein n=1 Tax=Streptomyces sp. NPDC047985 TaxID=3155384 RepID=UPI003434C188
MVTRSTIITATTTVAVAAAAAAALAATNSTFASADGTEKPETPAVARQAAAPAPAAHEVATPQKADKDDTGANGAESRGDERGRGEEGGDEGQGRDDGGDRGNDQGDDEDDGGYGRGGGHDEGQDHESDGGDGGGYDRGHKVGRIHFNERTYPAYPDGCVTAASGLGSTSFNIFNESRMTVEVFSGATCDNGGPIAVVGPYGDTSGVIPQHVQGGVSVFNGVGASFRVVRHGHGGGWDDWDY